MFIVLFVFLILVGNAQADMVRAEQLAYSLGNTYDIDPKLVMAIIEVESNFNPRAVGHSHGETGYMQLNPRYFPRTFDPYQNVKYGVAYLSRLKPRCERKYGAAWFICYNVGPTRNIKNPIQFPYYRKVMSLYSKVGYK